MIPPVVDVVVGTVLAALGAASPAAADVVWLCKPGQQPNPCVGNNRTTVRRGAPARLLTAGVPRC